MKLSNFTGRVTTPTVNGTNPAVVDVANCGPVTELSEAVKTVLFPILIHCDDPLPSAIIKPAG
jgi:hypothetical protein